MKYADTIALGDTPNEMAIVDTFTRLIFADEGTYSAKELEVVAALRCVEPELAADDMLAMGEYLRALGVAEMMRLVSRVQPYCGPMQAPLISGRRRKTSTGRRPH